MVHAGQVQPLLVENQGAPNMLALKGLVALFPSADADGVAYRGNKYFAVPNSPRLGVVDDYVDCLLGVVVSDHQIQLDFGQYIDQ
jgi:hypothetical protein